MQKKVLLILAVLICHCPRIVGEDSIPTAEQTLQRLQLSEGLKAELVAKEPLMRNPVCFWLDPTGKIYVCESDRQNRRQPAVFLLGG